MKLSKLIERIDVIESNSDLDVNIDGICYDSRKANNNYLFVAINGLNIDGNQYISSAIDNGCIVIVTDKKPVIDCNYILVTNSRKALAYISAAFYDYPAEKMVLIGVTGTSGKTTTTQLTKHVLEESIDCKIGLIGTNCNMIGNEELHSDFTTPESLELHALFKEMYDSHCTHVIMEVSSHSIALDRVAGIVFDVAAFTNLSQDHLDFHSSMIDYASTKRNLFSNCKKACLNLDDDYSSFMLENIDTPLITTSLLDTNATIFADDIEYSEDGVCFRCKDEHNIYYVNLNIPGVFSVYNALTVISLCYSLNIDSLNIVKALKTANGVKGRVEKVKTYGDYSVIIDYSHKPDALEKVLKSLRTITRNRLVVLFGCGGDRDKLKRPIMGKIALENSDFVVVTSDNPRTEDPNEIISEILVGMKDSTTPYKVICDRIDAINWSLDNMLPGDVLLLAGKGHEDYQIIGHDKIHMDEREIVADYYRNKGVL